MTDKQGYRIIIHGGFNMKSNSKIILLSSVLVCATFFTSCSDKKNSGSLSSKPAVTTESTEFTTENTVSPADTYIEGNDSELSLARIKQDNNLENVLNDTSTTYECNCTYYNDDGSQQNVIYSGVQISNGQYYYTKGSSAGDVIYTSTEKGKSYSEIPVNSFGVPYGIRFIDNDTAIKEIEQMNTDHLNFSEYEKITKTTSSEDIITVTTEIPVSEETQGDLADFYSYVNMNLFTNIKKTYEINADTKLCIKSSAYGVAKTGQTTKLASSSISYSNNALKMPDFVGEIESMTDMRTITVTDENGNVSEYQIPKNVLFAYTTPNGYMMYTDKDGKNIFSNSDYLDKDASVYILQVK